MKFLMVDTDSSVPWQYLRTTVQLMSRILTQACFTFCVVCATVSIFCMHAGKKCSTQNEECMNISISMILPVHHVQ